MWRIIHRLKQLQISLIITTKAFPFSLATNPLVSFLIQTLSYNELVRNNQSLSSLSSLLTVECDDDDEGVDGNGGTRHFGIHL